MTEFEMNCYGMSQEEIVRQYIEPNKLFDRDDIMIAGVLSDCQALLEMDESAVSERVRKQLNIAKFLLFYVFDVKGKGAV